MEDLPLVLCGPMVRRTAPDRVCIWLALKASAKVDLIVFDSVDGAPGAVRLAGKRDTVELGEHLHVVAVTASLKPDDPPLAWGSGYLYELIFETREGTRRLHDEGVLGHDMADASSLKRLVYEGQALPGFRLPGDRLEGLRVVHGSCRKPHGKGQDALEILDDLLAGDDPPQMLFMTGDQIYADDVDPAAELDAQGEVPRGLLHAITERGAELFGGDPERQSELAAFEELLQPGKRAELVKEHGSFTSSAAECHLITLVEFYTMYLFQWSDVLWQRPIAEKESLRHFHGALPRIRRALANISTYMAFDDHDVTDDWNRTQLWIDRVAASQLGGRIVRNGMTAYALFQHWGNQPEDFEAGAPGDHLLTAVERWDGTAGDQADTVLRHLYIPSSGAEMEPVPESALRWHFYVETPQCRVVALDTRTRRHFETPHASPGLMTRAAIDQVLDPSSPPVPALMVISPAPVLGVGLIEFIQQKVALWIDRKRDETELISGQDKFDAEAWSFDEQIYDYFLERLASFRRVLLLSGDVHYGFGGSLVAEHMDARIVNFISSSLHNETFGGTLSKLLNVLISDRDLERVRRPGDPEEEEMEAVPSHIPDEALHRSEQTKTLRFREQILHEGGDRPASDMTAAERRLELEAFPGSHRRGDVIGSCNLGEITFVDGKVVQQLRWHGRKKIRETRHVATFPID